MPKTATVTTNAMIDVSPNGIVITFPSLDKDVAELIEAAGSYSVLELKEHSFDTVDVQVSSDKKISFIDKT